ncbi:MAG: ATP-dependent helicase HrpB, partial [Planctomycetota bacterium]
MGKPERLPIDPFLPGMVERFRESRTLVLKAPPGAGKTTRLPPALLDAGVASSGMIVVLEPRRIAARSAARRIAGERGQRLGEEVGYQIRFEQCHGPETRILILTEGILTRRLQSDPFLEGVSCVLLDEFHERSLHTDLALSFLKELRREARPDLMVGVMSATLATGPVAEFLGGAPVMEVHVENHPLEISYLDKRDRRPLHTQAAAAVARALHENSTPGDVLVFLPGMAEIKRAQASLASLAHEADLIVVPLHGELPNEMQDRALLPQEKRKIILSTNVAETSLTIEGVTTVIDSGFARIARHDPRYGMDRLEQTRISRSSADQRAGRAGRTGPGRVYRLWTRSEDAALAEASIPEVMRTDLASPMLEIMAWGASDPSRFSWFEPPPQAMVNSALDLLVRLDAVQRNPLRITRTGRKMLALPMHPRLAKILIQAGAKGCLAEGALMAALLSERDILPPVREGKSVAHPTGSSDLLLRLELMRAAEKEGFSRAWLERAGVAAGAARAVHKAADHYRKMAKSVTCRQNPGQASEETLNRVLLAGYPDRVACRRSSGESEFLMMGGRGAKLSRYSVVRGSELVLGIAVEGGQKGRQANSLIRMAGHIELDWLKEDFPELLRTEEVFHFDEDQEKVTGERRVLFDDLPLDQRPLSHLDPKETSLLLERAAAQNPAKALCFDRTAESFRTRVWFLAHWMPELGFPSMDEAEMQSLLPLICAGRKSFSETRSVKLLPLLRTLLNATQSAALEKHAPEKIAVPNGRNVALTYDGTRPPRISIRLQELFGMRKA